MLASKSSTALSTLAALAILTGCAGIAEQTEQTAPRAALRKETVYAVTATNQLVSFNAGQPDKLLSKKPLTGLQPNETVVGADYRVAKGMLYAVGSGSRLYLVDAATGHARQVGSGIFAAPLAGSEFGIDFNPVVDRIRVVSNIGQDMRLHPDTGAVVDSNAGLAGLQIDGPLAFAASDVNAGKPVALVAAGYTYNKLDEKLTTNFALDAKQGLLVTQGTREGKMPAVSPNTGQVFTVGALGVPAFERAAFDIADVSGAAFAALTAAGGKSSAWYEVDLQSGKAHLIGNIGGGEPVVAISIEP